MSDTEITKKLNKLRKCVKKNKDCQHKIKDLVKTLKKVDNPIICRTDDIFFMFLIP
jgi:hypothetical protein